MSLGDDGTYGSTYKTLGLTGNTNGTHRILAGTADDLYIAAATSRGITFLTNGTNTARMTILSSGNVGIGTSSPASKLQVEGGELRVTTSNSGVALYQSLGNGEIAAYNWGGSAWIPLVYGGSEHRFNTSGTERMTITSIGQVLMNTNATVLTSGWLCIAVPSSNYNAIVLKDTGTTYSSGNYYQIFTNSNNGIAGGIVHNSASTVSYYTGPSDARLKSNIQDWTQKVLPLFANIKPKTYNHIEDNDESVVYKGYLAQDMVDKFPEAYGQNKDGYYTFNPNGYIVYLVKAIQELKAEIDALKAQ